MGHEATRVHAVAKNACTISACCDATLNAIQAKQCCKHTALCSATLSTTHGKSQGSCRYCASTCNPQVVSAANPTLLFLVGGLLRRTMIFGCLAGPLFASTAVLPCKGPAKTVLRPVYYILLYARSIICTTAQCTHSMTSYTDIGSRTVAGHT